MHYFTLDVFTDQRFGGNPLAVILDARGLSTAQMLQVTREFNYSKSTFVLPAEDGGTTKRVRIFTPGGEVPFAGHPTIGTAIALVFSGDAPATGEEVRVVLGENVGPVPVTVRLRDGVPAWAQLSTAQMPSEQPPMDRDVVAELLELAAVRPGGNAKPRTNGNVMRLAVPDRATRVTGRGRACARERRGLCAYTARHLVRDDHGLRDGRRRARVSTCTAVSSARMTAYPKIPPPAAPTRHLAAISPRAHRAPARCAGCHNKASRWDAHHASRSKSTKVRRDDHRRSRRRQRGADVRRPAAGSVAILISLLAVLDHTQ